ncbi:hypothetical protein LJC60_08695 [Ruminococcaceae bacterium OttesenSCG-928-D13]|nr:hypothetical protein [Ruminococcaceae bacterium OttesenSCG-928-D13]
MEIEGQIASLYTKDTSTAYANLQALEALSQQADTLYPHLGEFIGMLQSGQYVVRVRGFRLLCLQARWDRDGVIDREIDAILAALGDEKPTAVRQMLQYLKFMLPYKMALYGKIGNAVRAIDLSRFKDTMAPLIMNDMDDLLQAIEAQKKNEES